MARNRKRRSEGRPHRPADGGLAQPGVATASAARRAGSPSPLQHATPEVDLVEAQLARGRPEPDARVGSEPDARFESEPDARFESEPDDADELSESGGGDSDDEDGGFGGGGFGGDDLGGGGSGGGGSSGRAVVPGPGSAPAPRGGSRIVHFLQGSWRELQRVQWPDRPQVMQATGVVIGFVIIAGLFLGLSDFVAQRVVNFILK